jgi:hypothetical protein
MQEATQANDAAALLAALKQNVAAIMGVYGPRF